jgi:hypothetical protein
MSLNQIFRAIGDWFSWLFNGIWNYPIDWGLLLVLAVLAASIFFGSLVMYLMARELFRGFGSLLSRLFSRPPRPQ